MTIEKIKPDNNFIISGDYNQLIPVNDNICFTKKTGKRNQLYQNGWNI